MFAKVFVMEVFATWSPRAAETTRWARSAADGFHVTREG